jgi:hypothetical protein
MFVLYSVHFTVRWCAKNQTQAGIMLGDVEVPMQEFFLDRTCDEQKPSCCQSECTNHPTYAFQGNDIPEGFAYNFNNKVTIQVTGNVCVSQVYDRVRR